MVSGRQFVTQHHGGGKEAAFSVQQHHQVHDYGEAVGACLGSPEGCSELVDCRQGRGNAQLIQCSAYCRLAEALDEEKRNAVAVTLTGDVEPSGDNASALSRILSGQWLDETAEFHTPTCRRAHRVEERFGHGVVLVRGRPDTGDPPLLS